MILLMLWNALAQIEVAGALNWPLIIGIVVVLVLVVLAIVIPSRKALKGGKAAKAGIEDGEAGEHGKKNGDLSLAEIKEAKRANVSGDKTKEEMRDLRKERRAATQTDKAVQRLESSLEEEQESNTSAVLEEVTTQTNTDTGDVFASLFGNSSVDKVDLSFEDEIAESSAAPKMSIPTLGSALIPLSEFADDDEAKKKSNELDPLDELTQRLTAKAEKKTQH